MAVNIGQRDHSFSEPLGLLTDCHRRIEQFLDILVKVTHQVHGGPLDSGTRSALNAAIVYFRDAAPKHIADEEESLFPRMKQCMACSSAVTELLMLELDHGKLRNLHEGVEKLVMEWLTRDRLSEAESLTLTENLSLLKQTYRTHIATEEKDIFPAAQSFLTEDQLQAIGEEMAERRANFHRP